MRRWLALLAVAVVGLALLTVLRPPSDTTAPTSARSAHAATTVRDAAMCPVRRVTGLKARSAGEPGRRVRLRVNADAGGGGIGALYASWGDGRTAIYGLRAKRRISLELAYSYRQERSYRISVVAERGAGGRCGLIKSPPTTLTVVVPLPHG